MGRKKSSQTKPWYDVAYLLHRDKWTVVIIADSLLFSIRSNNKSCLKVFNSLYVCLLRKEKQILYCKQTYIWVFLFVAISGKTKIYSFDFSYTINTDP